MFGGGGEAVTPLLEELLDVLEPLEPDELELLLDALEPEDELDDEELVELPDVV